VSAQRIEQIARVGEGTRDASIEDVKGMDLHAIKPFCDRLVGIDEGSALEKAS
jgi:hypothetical protein